MNQVTLTSSRIRRRVYARARASASPIIDRPAPSTLFHRGNKSLGLRRAERPTTRSTSPTERLDQLGQWFNSRSRGETKRRETTHIHTFTRSDVTQFADNLMRVTISPFFTDTLFIERRSIAALRLYGARKDAVGQF